MNFFLSTIHIGASLKQLLDAFVYAPVDVPNYSTAYWLNFSTPLRVLKDILNVTLVRNLYMLSVQPSCAQWIAEGPLPSPHPGKFDGYDNVDTEIHTCCYEVWRLFVIFLCNWKVVILPVGNRLDSICSVSFY